VESTTPSSELTSESADVLVQSVKDHYRCPENFLNFSLSRELSVDQGFFQFGAKTICYGRSCSEVLQPQAGSSLYDVLGDVRVDDAKVMLPFNPNEIIDNLRLERYANSSLRGSNFRAALKRLYYLLRPFTNRQLRKQVQRLHARNWRDFYFPKWPVDTTVEDICERLLLLSMEAKGVKMVPFVWFWPDGAHAGLTMTHDVETQAGSDQCDNLMDVDDSFGIKASFQIVPEDRYAVSPNLLESMRNRGFGIAIQDLNHDGRLFDNKEEFLRRVKIINRYAREYGAKGFRAAVLYRKPEWYDSLEVAFDMSIPNVAPLDPQRGGCCTVLPYFIGDVLELPVTTIQDYTLFHVLNEHSVDLWKEQLDLIMRKNGLASFIIHPDYIMEQDTFPIYKELLSHLRELRECAALWCALPTEVDSWWRARSKMSLVEDGNGWRIEGKESERAVLAYAKNVDGNLVYEMERLNGAN
jgi:hypothetical protein